LAIFLRRHYCTIRNYVTYLSISIPIAFLIAGAIVVNTLTLDDPKNPDEHYPQSAIDGFKLIFLSVFLCMAFIFSSSIFILLPVWEREHNLKYALNVMGCRALPYWFGTLAYDFLVYFFIILLFVIVCSIA